MNFLNVTTPVEVIANVYVTLDYPRTYPFMESRRFLDIKIGSTYKNNDAHQTPTVLIKNIT